MSGASQKKINFIDHAEERFIVRNIPLGEIRRFLRKGFVTDDPAGGGRKLCIYKECAGKYYTVVFQEFENDVFIITGWQSREWEIKAFEEGKRNAVPKM